MWKCHKCGKPVYFAERKQSLGYDWHPECLRCEECGKRLNPGQHAEHKGVPYCHVPCYGALFGPQLFGHGTRVESHTSFGKVENRCGGPNMPRSHLESKLKLFNQFYDGKSGEIRSREVNGRLVLEGALRIHWGVLGMIHLKEDDDQRTVVTVRKRNSCRSGFFNGLDLEVMDGVYDAGTPDTGIETGNSGSVSPSCSEGCESLSESLSSQISEERSSNKSLTLPPKLDVKQIDWDELDDLLQVERKIEDGDKLYQTMPVGLTSVSSQSNIDECPAQTLSTQSSFDTSDDGYQEYCRKGSLDSNLSSQGCRGRTCSEDDGYCGAEHHLNRSFSGPGCLEMHRDLDDVYSSLDELSADEAERIASVAAEEGVVVRRAAKTGSTAIRRRPGGRRRSRTKLRRRCSINGHFYDRETSFFTPPHGSQMSVWVTSLVSTPEVINLLLEKYKVDSKPRNFALFVMRDNGEQRRLRDDEYPLLVRVMLGPHEDVAKLFLMDRRSTEEISSEVAQFLNLSLPECKAILDRYNDEEEREIYQVLSKYREMRKRIKQRMDDLKVRL